MKKDGLWRRPLAWLEERAPKVHDFLTTTEKPKPAIREALAGFLVILLLVTVLWGATGQPLNRSPVVVIESESMMRCDQGAHANINGPDCDGPFGRIGTIDPGDLIFVHDVDGQGDVNTRADCLENGGKKRHGACGDTIVYRPGGDKGRTPIIHRTVMWLEIEGNGRFGVPECGLSGDTRAQIMASACVQAALPQIARSGFDSLLERLTSQHPYNNYGPDRSGFITLGDNNPGIDQGSNIAPVEPVQPEWILGKARGELPWLGLVKLGFNDMFGPTSNYKDNAPTDTKVMMWITLAVLIGGPFAYERVMRWRRERHA